MLRIERPQTVSLAAHLTNKERSRFGDSPLSYVRLDPDGTLWATDAVCILRAGNAHDGSLTRSLFVDLSGLRPSAGATHYTLDVSEGVLTEHRARSTREHPVAVVRGLSWPAVGNAVPRDVRPGDAPECRLDSIRAGAVAAAYGLTVGSWCAARLGMHLGAALEGTDPEDLVGLVGLRASGTGPGI